MKVEKQAYRPKEAAAYLGVGLSTVWLYIAQNKLKATRLSPRVTVINKTDLDEFLGGGVEYLDHTAAKKLLKDMQAVQYA